MLSLAVLRMHTILLVTSSMILLYKYYNIISYATTLNLLLPQVLIQLCHLYRELWLPVTSVIS